MPVRGEPGLGPRQQVLPQELSHHGVRHCWYFFHYLGLTVAGVVTLVAVAVVIKLATASSVAVGVEVAGDITAKAIQDGIQVAVDVSNTQGYPMGEAV